jgi:hypothetical protein
MSARAVVSGAATAALLAAVLGSPAAQDAAKDAKNRELARTLTSFPSWDAGSASGDVRWSIAIRLAVIVLGTALLCAVAGRSASRGAALLAGWAAGVVAAAAAGAAAYAFLVATVFSGGRGADTYLDGLVGAANDGAVWGLWTAWLVGSAVAAVTHRRRVRARAAAPAPPPGALIADPPPPWWAPTEALDEDGEPTLRPGPAAYGAVHMPPVVAGLGEDGGNTHIMSTASGDPHPSDPDATVAVGFPGPDRKPEPGPEPDPDATEVSEASKATEDPDATELTEVEGQDDPTLHMPQQD